MKPSLFIGSSKEALAIANAIHTNLVDVAECTVWKDGVFQPSSSTLGDLLNRLRQSDFAIFVFSPDDVTTMRDQSNAAVRDNVLFELGLFIGGLGPERCFFLIPDSATMRLPSDLLGVTPARYEASRRDGNLDAAVNTACGQFSGAMRRLGIRETSKDFDATTVEVAAHGQSGATSKQASSSSEGKVTIEPYKNAFLIRAHTPSDEARIKRLPYASHNTPLKAWVIPKSKAASARVALADLL